MARACSDDLLRSSRQRDSGESVSCSACGGESSCSRDRLDSDEALEDAPQRELIDIAFTAGISDAETLCDRALRHLNKVGLP